MGSTWWVDDPISTEGAESLGRLPFVRRAVAMLDEIGAHPSSTVVALVGPWGSGKTSTVNLVLAALDEDRWGVSRLNPWALGSAEAIVAELLGAIGSALPGKAVRARERLATYAEVAAPWLALIPMAGEAASGAGELLARRLRGDGTLQGRFEQLSDELRKLARSVLVFVDDVDRLQPDELLALFRAVRVLGRLPHVHYFVAYDQRTLLDLLMATPLAAGREPRALAFLEKMVTLRVDQPLIRAEQSALLFNRRLTELLTDLRASLGDEERRRISDEWELLLAADLGEPRSINRFIAQLRVHLPLAGRDEVDLADFVVITHLRSAYPELYRDLLADRSMLAAPAGHADQSRLDAWRAPGTDRVRQAVTRMFPSLRTDGPAEPRRRGIGHPDYVDRYFTFMPSASDVTDADLFRALRDWARGLPGTPDPSLVAALDPDPANRYECARSASVIRRLDTLHEQLTPVESAAMAHALVGFLPLPPGQGLILGGPDAALVQWLSHLLARAGPLEVQPLVDLVAARGVAAMVAFLRAVPRGGELATLGGAAGWRMFREHAQLGNDAPEAPVESLFALVEDLLGAAETNRLLRRAVDDEIWTLDVAARLIEVGVDGVSGRPMILGLAADTLVNRLGIRRVRMAVDEGVEADEVVGGSERLDRFDLSWAGRRRYAATMLLSDGHALPAAERFRLPDEMITTFQNHSVLALDAPESPELTIAVTVLAPELAAIPRAGGPSSGPVGELREEILLAELAASRISHWLTAVAERHWPVDAEPWRISDPGDGRTRTRAAAFLRSDAADPADATAWRVSTPVRAGVQVWTGTTDLAPFIVADYQIGLWFSELDAARRSAGRRHNEKPWPAALLPDELITLISDTLAGAQETTPRLFDGLAAGAAGSAMAIQVAITAPPGIDAVVNLEAWDRAGGDRQGIQQISHSFIHDPARTGPGSEPLALAVAMVGEMLLRSGYRGYEESLLEILEREIT